MKAVIILALALILAGCTGDAERNVLVPDVIRIGVLPDQSPDSLIEKYTPLVNYLKERTSLEIVLVIPDDYLAMLDDFSAQRIHLANFGGLTFTEAERRDNAEPLVMRDVDLNFASCYLVRQSDNRPSISQFKGETFAFGPQLSTSGHLMPRYYLQSAGIDAETFFASIRHSSGHDETAIWVKNREVTAGVANCVIVESMLRDGRLAPDEVRILETTPAYANYVWAVNQELDPAVKTRLRDAFLALDATLPQHRPILQKLGAHAYLPASRADFEDIRRAAHTTDVSATPGPR